MEKEIFVQISCIRPSGKTGAQHAERLGYALEPARPVKLESNGDRLGWRRDPSGHWIVGLYIENGRVSRDSKLHWMDALRELAEQYSVRMLLTPN